MPKLFLLIVKKKGGCTVTYKKNGRSLPLMSDAVVLATGGFLCEPKYENAL